MKILKHGKFKSRKFICGGCGCEFVAEVTEYSVYEVCGATTWYSINCPECNNEVSKSEPWEGEE